MEPDHKTSARYQWQVRTPEQLKADERWRAEYSASLRDTPHYRATSNVLVW